MQAVVSSCVCSVFFSAALSAVFSPILDEVLPGLPFVAFLLDGFPVCAAFSPSAFFAFSLTVLLVLLHLPLFLCDWARKSMCSSLGMMEEQFSCVWFHALYVECISDL